MVNVCFFNDCANAVDGDAWKCDFHKHRARCLVDDCHNQVYARNLCVRHGGKKACMVAGCSANARVGTLCSKHATPATKKICDVAGCTKQAHARYKCVRHGGGSRCKFPGCKSNSRSSGLCSRHGKLLATQDNKSNVTIESVDMLQPIAFSQAPATLTTDLFDEVAECFSSQESNEYGPNVVVEWDLMHL